MATNDEGDARDWASPVASPVPSGTAIEGHIDSPTAIALDDEGHGNESDESTSAKTKKVLIANKESYTRGRFIRDTARLTANEETQNNLNRNRYNLARTGGRSRFEGMDSQKQETSKGIVRFMAPDAKPEVQDALHRSIKSEEAVRQR